MGHAVIDEILAKSKTILDEVPLPDDIVKAFMHEQVYCQRHTNMASDLYNTLSY